MKWFKPSEKTPNDGQYCILLGHDPGGLGMAQVAGPIAWREPKAGDSQGTKGMWLDLFATPEAGAVISTDVVAYWIPWDDIRPNEDVTAAA